MGVIEGLSLGWMRRSAEAPHPEFSSDLISRKWEIDGYPTKTPAPSGSKGRVPDRRSRSLKKRRLG
jgi:hypothetical protein